MMTHCTSKAALVGKQEAKEGCDFNRQENTEI